MKKNSMPIKIKRKLVNMLCMYVCIYVSNKFKIGIISSIHSNYGGDLKGTKSLKKNSMSVKIKRKLLNIPMFYLIQTNQPARTHGPIELWLH